MQILLILIHAFVAVTLIVLVLLQHGKGADAGAAFGSGASSTMFGSQGATPFLVKVTGILAFVFFLTSLTLSLLITRQHKQTNTLEMPIPVSQPIPANSVLPQSSSVPPVTSSTTSH